MGLVLTVQGAAWRAHVDHVAASFPGLVPVVKGNGYGFGRRPLASTAALLVPTATVTDPVASSIAVGTVHEVADVPHSHTPMVLVPEMGPLPEHLPVHTVLTVGSVAHVEHLSRQGWNGPVAVKLASSMRRFGCDADGLEGLEEAIAEAGLEPIAYAVHPALAGSEEDHLADVEVWLPLIEPSRPVIVSHLGVEAYRLLHQRHGDRRFAIRIGSALWHGDKAALRLEATVADVRRIRDRQTAGYRLQRVAGSGHLVMVAAGSAHGVSPLPGGLSPFHYDGRRLELLEPPHMHTSMVLVPQGHLCPEPGGRVDVQRPLTQTLVDTVHWLP